MISREGRKYLNNPDYDMAMEYYIFFKQNKYQSRLGNCTVKKAYPFSNEPLDVLFNNIDCKDKSVLTVGSSGDQALMAIYNDASKVTVIDANPYAQAFIEYKIACIKNLEFDEFREYCLDNVEFFNWDIYKNISHDISPEVRQFWDTLFLEEDYNADYTGFSEIGYCILNEDFYNTQITCPFYSDKKSYYELREKLQDKKINYINSTIQYFAKDVDEVYDIVLLSNILKYENEDKLFASSGITGLYNDHLQDNGVMQLQCVIHNEYLERGIGWINAEAEKHGLHFDSLEKIKATKNYNQPNYVIARKNSNDMEM